MVKYLNYVFVSIITVMLITGCTQKIDFEHDVPQRAKSISKQQADNIRSSMEVPELKKEYKNYVMQQRKTKSLADLKKEKREIERKIASVIQADSSQVCAVCRKKLKVKPSKQSLVMQKGKKSKSKNNKNKVSSKQSIVKTKASQKNKNIAKPSNEQGMRSNLPEQPPFMPSQFNLPAEPQSQVVQVPQGSGYPLVSNQPFPQQFPPQPPMMPQQQYVPPQPPLLPQPQPSVMPQQQYIPPQPPFLPQSQTLPPAYPPVQ